MSHKDGAGALYYAAYYGHVEIVTLLILSGADMITRFANVSIRMRTYDLPLATPAHIQVI